MLESEVDVQKVQLRSSRFLKCLPGNAWASRLNDSGAYACMHLPTTPSMCQNKTFHSRLVMARSKKRKLDHQLPSKSNGHPLKVAKTASQRKNSAHTPTPEIPFDAEDRILLVGEGDFSFAKSIVEHHGCCDVIATCFDSPDELMEKYKPQAEEHIACLEDEGQKVLYHVDATKLKATKSLAKERFERIIFNFPHVGGKTKDVNRQVRFNQELLVKFFASAKERLDASGTIVVTLFEGEPYTLWNIRDLARHAGLEVARSFKFNSEAYPGYAHARTLGNIDGGGGWKGEDREARSFVFQIKGISAGEPKRKKRKSGDGSGDDD